LHEIVAGLAPGLLMLIGILALTTVIGAAAGAAVGALAGGVGAIPGAAIGAEVGFEAGVAILEYLGIAFLAVYIGKSLAKAVSVAGQAVRLAWDSVDDERSQEMLLDRASRKLALAVALVFRGVLQGIVAFLLAKGTAAAAARVPEVVAKLRTSRLGAVFADWVERNWQRLITEPRLKDTTVPGTKSGGGSGGSHSTTSNEPLKVTKRVPEKQTPIAERGSSKGPPLTKESGTGHAAERHGPDADPKWKGKSKFDKGENIDDLVMGAKDTPATQQPNGNWARTYDVGRTIGTDATNGNARTSMVTVIQNPQGKVITAFPGAPR
jgi:hypothetical protein